MLTLLRFILYPFSMLFGLVLRIRHLLFDRQIFKSAQFEVPVICVGNITVGGTGKTPVIQYITKLMLKHNIKPAILSRGYGRSSSGFKEVMPDSLVKEVGDEPLLHACTFNNLPVAVCEDRAIGISEILSAHTDVQCVLLDDAYQHRWVKPQINILLTSFNCPFFHDYLLPAGNNRDVRSAARRADYLIFTRTPDDVSKQASEAAEAKARRYLAQHAQIFFTTMEPTAWQEVFSESVLHTNTNAQKAVAFAGIAQNNSFFESLKAFKLTHCISFDDHHQYNDLDVERLYKALKNAGSQAILLTTAKDAVKLRQMSSAAELLSGRIFYRDIKVSFLHGQKRFEESLLQDIAHIQHLKY